MKIYIDNQLADTDERTEVSVTLSVASHSDLETSRMGYSKSIMLPATPRNRKLLSVPEDVNAAARFNIGFHRARIECDGCVILEGVPYLAESSIGGQSYYKINIVGSAREWIGVMRSTPLRGLSMIFSTRVTGQNIKNSWTSGASVRFLPVHRPGLEPRNVTNNIIPPQRTLTSDDYHPFINLKALLESAFLSAGYTMKSDFFNTDEGKQFFISGNYANTDMSAVRSRIDFRAGRVTTVSTTANYRGIAYSKPGEAGNSLGNIVDTVDPSKLVGGVAAGGVFSNEGCFRRHDDGHMEFRPPIPVTLAFEYNILYRTAYRLDTETGKLKGFDTINLDNDNEYKFDLRLPFPDHKTGVLQENHAYKIFVYGHRTGDAYRYTCKEITNPQADINNLKKSDYNDLTSAISTAFPVSLSIGARPRMDYKLTVRKAGTSTFVPVPDADWAIYDVSFKTTGTMDVEVTLRTKAHSITPATPKTFYDLFFSGADPGMAITLLPGTTLRPVFTYGATEGQLISFRDIAAHDNVSCLDVLRACKQLFNLYFYTDHDRREVVVEPRNNFYADTPTVDLTGRIDHSKPIVVSEPTDSGAYYMTFAYAPGDEAAGADAGSWTTVVGNPYIPNGERRYTNPLFTPSAASKGAYSRAPSAELISVGSERNPDEPNFPMKIVRYLGMKNLPAGEVWGWPGNTAQYPLAVFSNPAEGVNLSFADVSRVQGMNRWWKKSIDFLSHGSRVQLYLGLKPHEIEPLVRPVASKRDFRARYRLTINGESAIYRLEEVADYNPASKRPTKCTFIKQS